VVILRGLAGGIPTRYTDEPRRRAAARGRRGRCIDKDLASALLRRLMADALVDRDNVDAVYADWGTPDQRRSRAPAALARAVRRGLDGPKWRRRAVRERTGTARIGSIDDTGRCCAARPGRRPLERPNRPPHLGEKRDGPPTRTTGAPPRGQPGSLCRRRRRRERSASDTGTASPAEAAARLDRYGPNRFAEAPPEPRWRAFGAQYRDLMQIVLLVAGIGSIWPLKELGTGLVLLS
jgi:hypothetical protein